MNKITIRDATTLDIIVEIENIINPVISEQVNAHYTFSFETVYDEKSKRIINENIVEVDGDYFKVSRIVKQRGNTVTLNVECEHISYALNNVGELPEEMEGTAFYILSTLLNGTSFNPSVSQIGNQVYYFRPSDSTIRQNIIELANLVGCELYSQRYSVALVNRRGVNNGLEIELGENLIGVTMEIDSSEDEFRTSLEVDMIDVGHLPAFSSLATVNLGDTVRVIDPILEIDETLRVVSYERDPFQKATPQLQIGNVIRNITEYIRDEEDEAIVKTNESWLEVFSIGDVNVLYLDNLESGGAILEITEKAPTITIQVKQEHIADAMALNLYDSSGFHFANYNEHAFDLNGRIIISGDFPRGTKGAVEVIITNQTTAEQREYFVSVEDSTAEPIEDYWLESVLVGSEECLFLDGFNITNGGEGADLFVYEKVSTITIKVKNEYKDYVKAVSIYNDAGVIVYTRGSSHFDANGKVIIPREFPLTERGSIKIAVMHPVTKVKQSYLVGVSIDSEDLPDASWEEYLMEFGTCPLAAEMVYTFENLTGYDSVKSITTGLIGDESIAGTVTLVASPVVGNGKVKSVRIKGTWSGSTKPNVEISVQVVCFNAAKEV